MNGVSRTTIITITGTSALLSTLLGNALLPSTSKISILPVGSAAVLSACFATSQDGSVGATTSSASCGAGIQDMHPNMAGQMQLISTTGGNVTACVVEE